MFSFLSFSFPFIPFLFLLIPWTSPTSHPLFSFFPVIIGFFQKIDLVVLRVVAMNQEVHPTSCHCCGKPDTRLSQDGIACLRRLSACCPIGSSAAQWRSTNDSAQGRWLGILRVADARTGLCHPANQRPAWPAAGHILWSPIRNTVWYGNCLH